MFDDFAPKLARLLTEYSQPVNPGDKVGIEMQPPGKPLALALYEAVLRRGGHPHVTVGLLETRELFYELATDEQLAFVNPLVTLSAEVFDIEYSIMANENTKFLNTADQARMTKRRTALRPLNETFMQRITDGELRWCGLPWPAAADAQDAGMGIRAFSRFVYQACGLNQDDPVAYWRQFEARQDKLIQWLSGKEAVEVKGPGVELCFSLAGRRWDNCCGHINMPDGEIFTAPVEDSVNGHIAFNMPSQFAGQSFKGVELTFKDGVIVDASAEQGEENFISLIDTDAGARRIGEFAIGTNPFIQTYTGSTIYDEKIGGTIHMALGFSLPNTNGVNKSAIHFDMVHDMRNGGDILIDGELFYQAGKFIVE